MMTRTPWYFLNHDSREFLAKDYLLEGQTPEGRYKQIADTFGQRSKEVFGIEGDGEKFFDYLSRGFYSLASPVLSNYGLERGTPVSCSGNLVGDSIAEILDTHAENGMLMKNGFGCSSNFNLVRPRGANISNNGQSSGSVHFMKMFEQETETVSQGSVRRGFISCYLDIEHDDLDEFLKIGREGSPIQTMTTGVSVSDEFLAKVKARDVDAMGKWAKVLQARAEAGFPYIIFTGNATKQMPDIYQFMDMEVLDSNMCTEIMLPKSLEESFTCVLSSYNLENWEEIKKTDAIEVLIRFLDTVNQELIDKIDQMTDLEQRFLKRIRKFAERHKALGAGVLGWHSLLQDRMIPFESTEANKLVVEIHKEIKNRAYAESQRLGEIAGYAPIFNEAQQKGYTGQMRRHTTLLAIAPTKSSSFILGQVSQGIEPERANIYVKDLAKGKVTFINPRFMQLLVRHGKHTPDVISSVIANSGSCQHLDFLSQHEKDVFRTMFEMNPTNLVMQNSVRQSFVDQGISLNLPFDPSMSVKELNQLILLAHETGHKSLYYQYALNAAQQFARGKLQEVGCQGGACEG